MPIIYHYEEQDKYFIGSEKIDLIEGVGLPWCSTEIPPPIDKCHPGYIPIFNNGEWIIVEDNFWRPTLKEVSYKANREKGTYRHLELSPISKIFPVYPSLPKICNTFVVTHAICEKVKLIQKKMDQIIKIHNSLTKSYQPHSEDKSITVYLEESIYPSQHYEYRLEIESMIFLMRKVIDTLVQLTYLITNKKDYEKTQQILVSEIGKVFQSDISSSPLGQITLGHGQYEADTTNFLKIINDLFNSYKHSLMHDESYELFCIEEPSVVSFQAKHNNHTKEIIFHNHSIYHLCIGFQDTLLRILKNQNIYLAESSSEQ